MIHSWSLVSEQVTGEALFVFGDSSLDLAALSALRLLVLAGAAGLWLCRGSQVFDAIATGEGEAALADAGNSNLLGLGSEERGGGVSFGSEAGARVSLPNVMRIPSGGSGGSGRNGLHEPLIAADTSGGSGAGGEISKGCAGAAPVAEAEAWADAVDAVDAGVDSMLVLVWICSCVHVT